MADGETAVNTNYPHCKRCGDGAEPGHELCSGCEKKRDQKPSLVPQDNWRRSVRFPKSRYRR